jgi:hypothetical protein
MEIEEVHRFLRVLHADPAPAGQKAWNALAFWQVLGVEPVVEFVFGDARESSATISCPFAMDVSSLRAGLSDYVAAS